MTAKLEMIIFLFQNAVNLVKLLLNNSFCVVGEGQGAQNSEGKKGGPFSLSKQHSRHVFHISPIDETTDEDKEDEQENSGKNIMARS